jgi:RHS repeat-associated protein
VIQTSSGPTNTPTATLTPTRTPTAIASNTPTATPAPPFSNAVFVYDGDGNRVKSTINGTLTTYFVGAHYEVTGSTITKYYYAGSQRIAMRTGGTLFFTLGDHLGSTSLATFANGTVVSELRYKAWGEVRYASGNTPTKYTFTGQYSDSYINLLWYGSPHYDPELGRFISPDTIVPTSTQGVQAYDRYAYVSNNPIRYIDPSGHKECDYKCQIKYEMADPFYEHYGEGLSCWGPTECWGVKPNTVVSKALAGDSSAIINAVLPTTGGVRGQLEIVPKEPICFFGVCVPVSVTLGLNIVANRIDGEISGSVDFSPELGPALQPDPLLPVDVSVTGGPMFTWFSSDAQQVTTGDSTVMSATIAAGEAYSAAIVTSPLGVPPDPMYGVKPVTLYAGVLGAGTGYASIGGGVSHTLYETSFNFYDLFR